MRTLSPELHDADSNKKSLRPLSTEPVEMDISRLLIRARENLKITNISPFKDRLGKIIDEIAATNPMYLPPTWAASNEGGPKGGGSTTSPPQPPRQSEASSKVTASVKKSAYSPNFVETRDDRMMRLSQAKVIASDANGENAHAVKSKIRKPNFLDSSKLSQSMKRTLDGSDTEDERSCNKSLDTIEKDKEGFITEAMLFRALGKDYEFTNVRVLVLNRKGLENIENLRLFNGLEELCLKHNNISDISCLSRLNGLRVLDLSFNKIRDISPLREMQKMTRLSLFCNEISEISSSISRLFNLRFLSLGENLISYYSEVENLKSLPKLHSLWLKGNKLEEDISSYTQRVKDIFSGSQSLLYFDGSPFLNYCEDKNSTPEASNEKISQMDANAPKTSHNLENTACGGDRVADIRSDYNASEFSRGGNDRKLKKAVSARKKMDIWRAASCETTVKSIKNKEKVIRKVKIQGEVAEELQQLEVVEDLTKQQKALKGNKPEKEKSRPLKQHTIDGRSILEDLQSHNHEEGESKNGRSLEASQLLRDTLGAGGGAAVKSEERQAAEGGVVLKNFNKDSPSIKEENIAPVIVKAEAAAAFDSEPDASPTSRSIPLNGESTASPQSSTLEALNEREKSLFEAEKIDRIAEDDESVPYAAKRSSFAHEKRASSAEASMDPFTLDQIASKTHKNSFEEAKLQQQAGGCSSLEIQKDCSVEAEDKGQKSSLDSTHTHEYSGANSLGKEQAKLPPAENSPSSLGHTDLGANTTSAQPDGRERESKTLEMDLKGQREEEIYQKSSSIEEAVESLQHKQPPAVLSSNLDDLREEEEERGREEEADEEEEAKPKENSKAKSEANPEAEPQSNRRTKATPSQQLTDTLPKIFEYLMQAKKQEKQQKNSECTIAHSLGLTKILQADDEMYLKLPLDDIFKDKFVAFKLKKLFQQMMHRLFSKENELVEFEALKSAYEVLREKHYSRLNKEINSFLTQFHRSENLRQYKKRLTELDIKLNHSEQECVKKLRDVLKTMQSVLARDSRESRKESLLHASTQPNAEHLLKHTHSVQERQETSLDAAEAPKLARSTISHQNPSIKQGVFRTLSNIGAASYTHTHLASRLSQEEAKLHHIESDNKENISEAIQTFKDEIAVITKNLTLSVASFIASLVPLESEYLRDLKTFSKEMVGLETHTKPIAQEKDQLEDDKTNDNTATMRKRFLARCDIFGEERARIIEETEEEVEGFIQGQVMYYLDNSAMLYYSNSVSRIQEAYEVSFRIKTSCKAGTNSFASFIQEKTVEEGEKVTENGAHTPPIINQEGDRKQGG